MTAGTEEHKAIVSELQKTVVDEVGKLKEQLEDELKAKGDNVEDIVQNEEFQKSIVDVILKRKELQNKAIELPEDKTEKAAAFLKALFTDDKATLKAMSSDTGGEGGYTVPEDFIDILIMPPYETGNIDALGFSIQRDKESGKLPRVTGGVTTSRTGMNDAISDSEPTFGQEAYDLSEPNKGLTLVPREFLEFSAIDAPAILRKLFSQALNDDKWSEFVVGAGSTAGKGLDEYSHTDGVIDQVAQNGATIGFYDLVSATIELPTKYHANARWLMRTDTYRSIMGMTDGNDRALFLQDMLTSPKNHTLLGYPVELNDNLLNTYGGADRNIYFGDFTGYWKVKKANGGYELAMSDQYKFANNQIAIRVIEYDCGRLADYDSFIEITGVTLK